MLEAVDMAVVTDCICVPEAAAILAVPAVNVGDDVASDQIVDSLTEEPLGGIEPVAGVVVATANI